MTTPTYTPKRTQYPFDMSLRYKTKSEIMKLQMQWETFERIENYDDVIYQRIQAGYRDKPFYQFASNEELKNYKAGQDLHVLRYPALPASTFAPVRDRPFPTTPAKTPLPYYYNTDKYINAPPPMTADELTKQKSDDQIYVYVSTFNRSHVYKYEFTSNEEKMAYYRAERRLRTAAGTGV